MALPELCNFRTFALRGKSRTPVPPATCTNEQVISHLFSERCRVRQHALDSKPVRHLYHESVALVTRLRIPMPGLASL